MKKLYLLEKWLYENNLKKEALLTSKINRLHKYAVSKNEIKRLKDWLNEDYSKLSFDELFDGKLRVVIPYETEDADKLSEVVDFLREKGWFPAGGSNRFELKTVDQKMQNAMGSIYTIKAQVPDLKVVKKEEREIPFGPRAGEVITRNKITSISKVLANPSEGAPEWMSKWWQEKQAEYAKDYNWRQIESSFAHGNLEEKYSVLISRDPIDVLRMSDHENIRSCHSEGNSYFNCAIKESRGHGPVAYLIENSDLNDLLRPPGSTKEDSDGINIGDLDGQEIFRDIDRNIEGMAPVSRVRLRKYVNEIDEYEFAVPEDRTYGRTPPGFIDVVRDWAWKSQKHLFEHEGEVVAPPEDEIRMYGGSYRDTSDGELLNNFFSKGGVGPEYYGNVETDLEEGEEDVATLWAEEVEDILDQYRTSFENIYPDAEVHDDWGDQVTVTAGVSLRAEVPLDGWEEPGSKWEDGAFIHPGELKSIPITYRAQQKDRSFTSIIEHDEYGEINNIDIVSGNLVIDLDFRCDDCTNPDDISSFFEWAERDIDSKYNQYIEKVRRGLVDGGYIKPKAFDSFDEKMDSALLSNLDLFGDKDDYDGEILISPKPGALEYNLEKLNIDKLEKAGIKLADVIYVHPLNGEIKDTLFKINLDQEKRKIFDLLYNIEKQKFEEAKSQLNFPFYKPDDLNDYRKMFNNLKLSAKVNLNSNSSLFGTITSKFSIYVYSNESDAKLNLAEKFIKEIDKQFENIKNIIENGLEAKIAKLNEVIDNKTKDFYDGKLARPIIEKLKGYNEDVRRLALWIEANWNNFTEEEKAVAYNQYLIPTERNGDYIHDERFDFPKWWEAWVPKRSDWSGISMKDIQISKTPSEKPNEPTEELETADEVIEYSEDQ
jgi:hypothetical protein